MRMVLKAHITFILVLYTIYPCISQDFKINKLEWRKDSKINLCFENNEFVLREVIEYYQLVIIDTTDDPVVERPVINVDLETIDDSTCATFGNSELTEYDGKVGTYFILTGRDANDMEVVFGTAQIDMPNFPETGHYVGTAADTSLRVNDHIRPASGETWSVSIEGQSESFECQYPKEGDTVPCYVISGLENAGENALTMCLDVTDELHGTEKINVCGEKILPGTFPADGPSLNELALDYTSKSLITDAKQEHNANKIDIVFYNSSYQKVYVNQNLKASVELESYEPDFKTYNILIVGLQAKQVKESSLKVFRDFNLNAQDLAPGSGIMEVQWKKTDDIDKFSLSIPSVATAAAVKDPFTDTTVNCPGASETFCYGYFVELTSGKTYDVTFKPFKADGLTENSANSILFKSDPISSEIPSEEKELKINHVNITWNTQDEAVVQLCFHDPENANLQDNDYEFIIMNDEGHWQREKGATNNVEGTLCSLGVTLPSKHFQRYSNVTGVIVKRDENSFDVSQSTFSKFVL